MSAIGQTAKAAKRPVAILIDELEYLSEAEFSALIMSIHKLNQSSLPVILIGAGLPQILGPAGTSKSYAERLFKFPEIGALDEKDAVNPAREEGVTFDKAAVRQILSLTERHPYFLQQWAQILNSATRDAGRPLGPKQTTLWQRIRSTARESHYRLPSVRTTAD